MTLANLSGLLRREGELELAGATLERADRIFAGHLPPSSPARKATRSALHDLA